MSTANADSRQPTANENKGLVFFEDMAWLNSLAVLDAPDESSGDGVPRKQKRLRLVEVWHMLHAGGDDTDHELASTPAMFRQSELWLPHTIFSP